MVVIQLRSRPEPPLLEEFREVPECSPFCKCGNWGSTNKWLAQGDRAVKGTARSPTWLCLAPAWSCPSPPQDVIQVSKKYLPSMAVGYSSPKLTLHVGDGFEFMKQNQDAFDVIITDSSDPMGKQRVGPGPSSSCQPKSQPRSAPQAQVAEWRTEGDPRTSAWLSRVGGPGHCPEFMVGRGPGGAWGSGLGPWRPLFPLQPPLCSQQASIWVEVGSSKPRPRVEINPRSASGSPPGAGGGGVEVCSPLRFRDSGFLHPLHGWFLNSTDLGSSPGPAPWQLCGSVKWVAVALAPPPSQAQEVSARICSLSLVPPSLQALLRACSRSPIISS